jgi:hypothetical protein
MYPVRSLDFDLAAAAADDEVAPFKAEVNIRSTSSSTATDFESDDGICDGKCEVEEREEDG